MWGECDYVSGYVEYTIGTKSVGVVVVLCPACACFFARNGLVNEVKFLGLIRSFPFKYPYLFEWVWH